MMAFFFFGIMLAVRLLFLGAVGNLCYRLPARAEEFVAGPKKGRYVAEALLSLVVVSALRPLDDILWEGSSFFMTSGDLPVFAAVAFVGIVVYGAITIPREIGEVRRRFRRDDANDALAAPTRALSPQDGPPYRTNAFGSEPSGASIKPPGRALAMLLCAAPTALALLAAGLYAFAGWRSVWPLSGASAVVIFLCRLALVTYVRRAAGALRYWLMAGAGMFLLAESMRWVVDGSNDAMVLFGVSFSALFGLLGALLVIAALRLKKYIRIVQQRA